MRRHILFISSVTPEPVRKGNEQRTAQLLDIYLDSGCDVTFLLFSLRRSQDLDSARQALARRFPPMCVLTVNGRMRFPQRMANLFSSVRRRGVVGALRSHLGFEVRDTKSSNMLLDLAFAQTLRAKRFDVVHVNYLSATPGNIEEFKGTKIVDLHDVLSDRFDAYADRNLPFFLRDVAKKWHRESEIALIRSFDRAIAIAEEDRADLLEAGQLSSEKIVTLPAFFPASGRPNHSSGGKTILFVGGTARANIEGILWYLRNIHRQITECVAGSELLLVGAVAESTAVKHEVERLRSTNIQLVGHVPDLANWYGRAAVIVAPILSGTGMKIKTAEAMWAGKAIVGTPEAFRGIKARHEENALIASEPEEFARCVTTALTNRDLKRRLERGARFLYAEQHSFVAAKRVLLELLDQGSSR